MLQHLRMDNIIAVNKADPFTASNGYRMVAGSSLPLIFLMNHPDSTIPGCIFITDCPASIGASIVHKDQFKVRKSLCQYAVNTAMNVLFYAIYGNNNTDFGTPPPPWTFSMFCLSIDDILVNLSEVI